MIATEPHVSLTAKYELREAAKILQVSTSTITKWTARGKLRAGVKRVNGRRFWTGYELLRAWRSIA